MTYILYLFIFALTTATIAFVAYNLIKLSATEKKKKMLKYELKLLGDIIKILTIFILGMFFYALFSEETNIKGVLFAEFTYLVSLLIVAYAYFKVRARF